MKSVMHARVINLLTRNDGQFYLFRDLMKEKREVLIHVKVTLYQCILRLDAAASSEELHSATRCNDKVHINRCGKSVLWTLILITHQHT